MAKQTINIGSSANKGDGDPLRTAFTKVNNNFTELYDRAVNTDAQMLTLTGDALSISGGNSVDLSKYVDSTFSGDYDDLTNKPIIPADIGDLTDTGNLLGGGAADSLTSNDDINITINNDDSSTYVWNFGNTGDLTAPGDITTGLVNTGGRFIQDCADGITSIRWVNVDQGDPVQIIRVYSDDPKINNDTAFERAQIGINWSASQAQSGLTITSFDSTDPDSANQIEHTWQFQGDGNITFPDATVQSTAYPGPQNTLDGDSISIGRVDAGEVDIYGDVEFNNGVTAFQPGNSVSFNGPVNFTNATVTGLSIAPQTTLDGDVTGSIFGDDSTLLVDGVDGKIVGNVETARLRTSETAIALGGGAGETTQGVRAVAIGEEAGRTDQGVRAVAIGYYAGQTNQSPTAVAIGDEAGRTDQGIRAVAVGYLAGGANQGTNAVAIGDEAGETTQGNRAVAIGVQAGETSQGVGGVAIGEQAGQTVQGVLSVAIGYYAGQTNQSFSAVAIGAQAGEWLQGAGAIAIGDLAGQTAQGNNSIVINATGVALNNTVANTFVVKPVRAATGTSILQYDATTGEITHTNEISSDQQISITVAGEDSTSKTWYFGNDGDLSLPGRLLLNSGGVQETFQPKVDATGVVDHDCALGQIFYHTSPDANWTTNFTNLDLGTSASTNLVLVVEQGATPYYPSAVQIGGAAQTIKWLGNVTPTPAANKTEIATFTIFNNADTFTVLGSYSTYG